MEITVKELYDFKNCPLRYKFVHINKIGDTLNKSEGLHAAIMSTLNYFYYKLQDGYVIPMTELKEKFSSIWYGTTKIYDILFEDRRKQKEEELNAIHMLQAFHRQQKYKPDQVVAVNLDFRVPFGNDFYVTGQIPVIRKTPNGLEIVNFKTGKRKYNEFWQKTDMEITLQAMAFHSIFKKEADSICVHHLRTGQSFYVERKKKDYQRLYKSIRMMKKTIDEKWFYPRESFMCDSCPARRTCMEWK